MNIVGKSVPSVQGRERVTGAVTFTPSIEMPGMVHAKVLRSPVPHARITRLDASRAEKLPGVICVLTRDDVLSWNINPYYGPVLQDQPIVAIDKVRYVGDIVAAVAAVDVQTAEDALELIEVDYEELPVVLDVEASAQPGAPLIHDRFHKHETAFEDLKCLDFGAGGNIASHFKLRKGDIAAGFAQADHIFEHTYYHQITQHGHLEPHASVAQVLPDGRIDVWSSTQNPSVVRDGLAATYKLPLSKVRVRAPFLGAGYGAKTYPKMEPLTVAVARKARRPVRLVLTREEVFQTAVKHAVLVKIKTGVTKNGTLIAREVACYFDQGAYADIGPRTSKNGGYAAGGPYKIANLKLDSYDVYTNKTPGCAYRGFGIPQVCWAYEQEMDRIAEALGVDGLQLRLQNIVRDGDEFATGEILNPVACAESLEAVAKEIGWGTPSQQPGGNMRRGKGIAVAIKSTMTPSLSSAIVKMEEDGSISVLSGSVDIGQGVDTSLAQIAAEALSVSLERVQVVQPDTAVTPYDQSTSSSRTTFAMGSAIAIACGEVRDQLLAMAAEQLEVAAEDLTLDQGHVVVKGMPTRRVSYEDVIRRKYNMRVGSIVGKGVFKTTGGLDPETGQGKASAFWFTSACGVEVEVDTDTGRVTVLKMASACNAGKAINPLLATGQIEGSNGMALGFTFLEELAYDPGGQPLNPNFLDYHMPTILDAPKEVASILIEKPHPENPYGAIGVGEATIPPVSAALGNAIYNAVGVRVCDLPIKPEKVLRGLRERAASAGAAQGGAGR